MSRLYSDCSLVAAPRWISVYSVLLCCCSPGCSSTVFSQHCWGSALSWSLPPTCLWSFFCIHPDCAPTSTSCVSHLTSAAMVPSKGLAEMLPTFFLDIYNTFIPAVFKVCQEVVTVSFPFVDISLATIVTPRVHTHTLEFFNIKHLTNETKQNSFSKSSFHPVMI